MSDDDDDNDENRHKRYMTFKIRYAVTASTTVSRLYAMRGATLVRSRRRLANFSGKTRYSAYFETGGSGSDESVRGRRGDGEEIRTGRGGEERWVAVVVAVVAAT